MITNKLLILINYKNLSMSFNWLPITEAVIKKISQRFQDFPDEWRRMKRTESFLQNPDEPHLPGSTLKSSKRFIFQIKP